MRCPSLTGPLRAVAVLALFAVAASPSSAQRLCNAGFESPALAAGAESVEPASAAWEFSGSGVTRPSPGCTGCQSPTPAPHRSQVAVIEGSGTFCQTAFNLVPATTYLVAWWHAGRAPAASSTTGCATCDGAAPYELWRTGDAFAMTEKSVEQIAIESYQAQLNKFLATATTHEFCFVGTGASADEATFIDAFHIYAIDEIYNDGFECGGFDLWTGVTGAS